MPSRRTFLPASGPAFGPDSGPESDPTSAPTPRPRRRLRYVLPLVALAASLTAACGGSTSGTEAGGSRSSAAPASAAADGGPTEIDIKTFIFRPRSLEVSPGTTVRWTNDDEILHTVTSGDRGAADGRFDGMLDGAGTTFSHTFETPGTYRYVCTIHPGMDAEVVVR